MQLMNRQAYKERGRVNAVGLSFLFFQGLLVETLSRLELGIRIGRGSLVQASRGGEGERICPCLAWYANLIALPTATEFGQMQG